MSTLQALRHLMAEDGDCLRWKAGCVGGVHPVWRIDGRSQLVRRVLWAEERGPIPDGLVLRMRCGMSRCCNLDHCVLMTRQGVAAECGALGLMGGMVRSAHIAATKRAGPQAKLTAQQVHEIRHGGESGAAASRRLGINQKTVSDIRRHKRWRDYGMGPMSRMVEVLT